MFTRAMVKQPCKNMINGISENHLDRPNYEQALKQHQNYISALTDCGLDVTILAPDDNFPDSTFIEDACLVTEKCAVLTRPGAKTRRSEPDMIAAEIRSIGIPVETISAPGTLDAGDVMMADSHFYIGLSKRTNKQGAQQLIATLEKYGLTGSTIELASVLHLKTGVSYLECNTMLAVGEFLTKKSFQKYRILSVPEHEGYAANSVWINGTVLVPDGHPETASLIESAGYEVKMVDVSEFQKLDGGLSCLSLRF